MADTDRRRSRRFGPLLGSTLTVAALAALALAVHEAYPRWSQLWRVRSLAAAMRSPDPLVGPPAARALSKAGPPAVPPLADALHDGDPAVRRRAAWALGMVTPLPAGAIPALGAALRDGDEEVRRRAADALARFGPEAASQAEALRAALADADPDVRFGAARALVRIERFEGEATSRALLDLLAVPVVPRLHEPGLGPRDPDRGAAAEVVRRMSPEAQARAVALLDRLVGSDDAEVRRGAVASLHRLGPAAGPAAPALERAARSGDLVTRCLAALALADLEGWERGRARATLQGLLDGGALGADVVPPQTLGEVRWVLGASLEGGSEISQPVHVLRDLADALRRAEARPGPAAAE